ncbi:MAG: NAD(P)-dependent oxidoreductase, partial [Clostridia bacterium]|nr:NAD(P)-dependent oxidoreductase [Clostridia bacterium]
LLTRTPERIPGYLTMENVTVVRGNILDLEIMGEALQGCDVVVHIALGWGNDPVEMLDHDTRVTAFLMDAAEKAGVKNFVYTSSTAAMGPLRDGMDETALLIPGDLYGSTKASTEMYLLGFNQYYDGQGVYGKKTSLRRNIIRPGYTFSNPAIEGGASQSDVRFKQIAEAVLKNEPITVNVMDGTQFISSRQIAELYVKLVESDLNKECFLALGTKFVSWGDIARIAKELVPESTSEIIEVGEKKTPSYYGVGKMERVFGLRFDGDEDLRDHIAWNIERARRELNGETVHNVYHVW